MGIFKVLSGLPSTGPMYLPFSAKGSEKFSEGFVVQFLPGNAEQEWVGNFSKGLTSFSTVLLHPDGTSVIIVSGGQGYVVDPHARTLLEQFGGWIQDVVPIPANGVLVFQGPTGMEAYGSRGCLWKTRRLAWDGIRRVSVQGDVIRGEASDISDSWVPFEVDLKSGKSKGGIQLQ
jgi:hypothetical protein